MADIIVQIFRPLSPPSFPSASRDAGRGARYWKVKLERPEGIYLVGRMSFGYFSLRSSTSRLPSELNSNQRLQNSRTASSAGGRVRHQSKPVKVDRPCRSDRKCVRRKGRT